MLKEYITTKISHKDNFDDGFLAEGNFLCTLAHEGTPISIQSLRLHSWT